MAYTHWLPASRISVYLVEWPMKMLRVRSRASSLRDTAGS
jgi:hypothetical protein